MDQNPVDLIKRDRKWLKIVIKDTILMPDFLWDRFCHSNLDSLELVSSMIQFGKPNRLSLHSIKKWCHSLSIFVLDELFDTHNGKLIWSEKGKKAFC